MSAKEENSCTTRTHTSKTNSYNFLSPLRADFSRVG